MAIRLQKVTSHRLASSHLRFFQTFVIYNPSSLWTFYVLCAIHKYVAKRVILDSSEECECLYN